MPFDRHITWPLPARRANPALELFGDLAHADMTVLLLHDDAIGALFPVAANGMSEAQCALIGTHRVGVGPFGIALSENRRVVVSDAWSRSQNLYEGVTRARLPFDRDLAAAWHRRTNGRRARVDVPALARGESAHAEAHRSDRRARGARGLARSPGRRRRARASQRGIGWAGESPVRRQDESRAAHAAPVDRGLHRLAGNQTADPLTAGQQRLLKRVRDNEELLVHVIDDLITFSRLEVGHITSHDGPGLGVRRAAEPEVVVAPLAMNRRASR